MKKIGVAILGLGVVGGGAYKILTEHREFYKKIHGVDIAIESILEADKRLVSDLGISENLISDNVAEICSNPDVDIVVEAIGGIEPAKSYILATLNAGKSVITSNMELICKFGSELKAAAVKNNVGLFYGASCVGGVPIVRTLVDNLQGNKILSVTGIINCATNYILTKMAETGKTYSEALRDAQNLGYMQSDPFLDVEGYDAAYKLSILLSLSFHTKVAFDNVYREGISNIDIADIEFGKKFGFILKPVAIGKCTESGIEVRVHPAFVKKSHPLASVNDNFNAVYITGDIVGEVMLYGKGAGALPTGSAIVGDILYFATHENYNYSAFHNKKDICTNAKFVNNFESEYYIRLRAKDKPGVLSKISAIFNKNGISVAEVKLENDGEVHGEAALILIAHKAKENSVKKVLDEINSAGGIAKVASVIRISD